MRLKLVTGEEKVLPILPEQLDSTKHYIGAMKENGDRYVLQRMRWENGLYRWACAKMFCAGDGLGGRHDNIREAVRYAQNPPIPMEVFVFTTARELFLWLAGEEVK